MKLGRILITLTVITLMAFPLLFDWNRTHVFNAAWPPHARFHNAVGIFMMFGYAVVALWLLWRRSADPGTSVLVATLVPVIAYGSFFIAICVPGVAGEDHMPRILRVPLNLFIVGITILVAVLGYGLCRRGLQKEI
jgi:hypothetical protein